MGTQTESIVQQQCAGVQTVQDSSTCTDESLPTKATMSTFLEEKQMQTVRDAGTSPAAEDRHVQTDCHVAVQTLPSEKMVQTDNDVAVQTAPPKPLCNGGKLPPPDRALALPPAKGCDALDYLPKPLNFLEPPDAMAPYLQAAKKYLEFDRVDLAFQTVFRMGNEKTLRAVLNLLDAAEAWRKLPEEEGRYLAHLLTRLLCRDPSSAAAAEACEWLAALARMPGGSKLLDVGSLPDLQAALFSLSFASSPAGACAAAVYHRLFQQAEFQRQPCAALGGWRTADAQPGSHALHGPVYRPIFLLDTV